ncbi:MAG: bifunctional nuclease family protein [Anaerolineaceae bacterium]|nr:bifunctional nuclease family protein [Anaerolineaceae bacterium]
MSGMVEVSIDSVRVSLTNQQRIVVLKEVNFERYLPIWIGPYEAESITIALQDIEVARPQTHDLLKNLIISMNARLKRVEISELKDDVFYGNLIVDQDGNEINVDTRPSDALALAVRSRVPIFVSKEVMESAGIIPEIEPGGDEETTDQEIEDMKQDMESEERLSVFEDFLQNLEIDGSDDSDTEDNQSDFVEPDLQ